MVGCWLAVLNDVVVPFAREYREFPVFSQLAGNLGSETEFARDSLLINTRLEDEDHGSRIAALKWAPDLPKPAEDKFQKCDFFYSIKRVEPEPDWSAFS